MHDLKQVTACGRPESASCTQLATHLHRCHAWSAASLLEKESCCESAAEAYLIQESMLQVAFAARPLFTMCCASRREVSRATVGRCKMLGQFSVQARRDEASLPLTLTTAAGYESASFCFFGVTRTWPGRFALQLLSEPPIALTQPYTQPAFGSTLQWVEVSRRSLFRPGICVLQCAASVLHTRQMSRRIAALVSALAAKDSRLSKRAISKVSARAQVFRVTSALLSMVCLSAASWRRGAKSAHGSCSIWLQR